MAVNKENVFFLFPGQGAQYPGMALDFLRAGSRGAGELFEIASGVMGRGMEALLRDSDAETLKRTDISQPAVTLANLAAAYYLEEKGFICKGCAGFSLGEYAALVKAGVISAEDCFRLVKERGAAMQAEADRLREEGGAPGMSAVIGLSPDEVERLIAEWKAGGLADLYAANINSPRQTVVAGTASALEEAESRFKAAGARRCVRLQVAGPFHSPLIAAAAERFRPCLEAVRFSDPVLPLYSNVTGKRVATGAEAQALAVRQITEPVQWVKEEKAVAAEGGMEACLETGPGKVLQGLWKDSGSTIPCLAAGTLADIDAL
ncbi:MAG: ACP S-malonyltransferase [Treponema sp.]|jgi:[acyl-carrier-protein] S-malonyltransferase|nr:ACP S-malonyltransferase [Treponema sp.]